MRDIERSSVKSDSINAFIPEPSKISGFWYVSSTLREPCARKSTIVCVFAHICVLFFAELFLTANLGSERSTCRKKTHTNLFLLCMNWWKPYSIFGGCNDFLENNSRFGYSWFFFDVLIILDIKYSWRGSQVGCEENFNFSWQRKAPTLL